MKNKTLVITGLGRCGTSLAMQLIEATGFPCHGEYPAFEEEDSNVHTDPDWNLFQKLKGKAVKTIDPHCGKWNWKDCLVVYLERDIKEQAKSHIKLGGVFMELNYGSRKDARHLASNLKKQNQQSLSILKKEGVPVFRFSFENMLKHPSLFIDGVGRLTGEKLSLPEKPLVYRRSPKCFDGFLELDLIERAK